MFASHTSSKSCRMKFASRCIAVTGASKGIGKGIAIALANEGATVYACGRNQADLDELSKINSAIITKNLDVTNWNEVDKWIVEIPKLDSLINNAGICPIEQTWEMTQEGISDTVAVNLIAPLHLTQAFSKKLIENNLAGCIVNISSTSSRKATPGRTAYCATKAAINQMTRSSAFELGPHKIRVNAVNPTFVMTDLVKKTTSAEFVESRRKLMPLGALPLIEDVVAAVKFLLSDDARMVTGQCLAVDSGILTS